MIEEGEQAPDFRLPAVVDGERREVGLADHLEENVVVLGFYPGDFNPACDGRSTGLDELDLFTMQKDIAVVGSSGDSVHSHRAFAAEYDLHVPLFADVRGEVTEAADTFDTAARFADSDGHQACYERADRKAEELSRAAAWLAQSAGAFASGEGQEGEQLRADAETPLGTARGMADPVPPDEFPPDDAAAEGEQASGEAGGGDEPSLAGRTGLVDEAAAGPAVHDGPGWEPGPGSERAADGTPDSGPAAAAGAGAAAAGCTRSAGSNGGDAGGEGPDGSDSRGGESRDPDGADGIDDAELAEIAAELEEQSRDQVDDADSPAGSRPGSGGTAGDTEAVEGEGELDLTDPDGGGVGGGVGSRAADTVDEYRADDERDEDDRSP